MEEDFWHCYLELHQNPATRMLHYIATAGFFVSAVSALLSAALWHLIPGLICGLTLTEISHRLIERRPSMLRRHPFSCLVCACRMSFSALTGHLKGDFAALKLSDKP